MPRFIRLASLLLSLVLLPALSSAGRGLTLMVYNVENLFDDVRDGTEYREFDPGRGWSAELFRLRVDTIAEVVRKAVPGGPDILALQEVENENALRALADSALKDLGYTFVVFVPKKGLAANLGVLSRLPVSRVHSFAVPRWEKEPTRDVVEVEIEAGGRTLHLLDNHWKSKTGGARKTEQARLSAAAVAGRRVREILSRDPAADVILAGDLNESIDEWRLTGMGYQTALLPAAERTPPGWSGSSIFLTAVPAQAGVRGDRLVLYDPWFEVDSRDRGSYYYHKRWETIDHALMTPGLFDGAGFTYRTGGFQVLRSPFLLTPRGAPRKWTGLQGERGYSDHLPLLVRLSAER
jgi:endonuclease/exonuclease/phosphatase family metal-dependent hydrolase